MYCVTPVPGDPSPDSTGESRQISLQEMSRNFQKPVGKSTPIFHKYFTGESMVNRLSISRVNLTGESRLIQEN